MSRDKGVKEYIESVLYGIGGIPNTGLVADTVWEAIKEGQEDFIQTEIYLREYIKELEAYRDDP